MGHLAALQRLLAILGKHVSPNDTGLSDRDFIEVVVDRFTRYHDHYLVDVSE